MIEKNFGYKKKIVIAAMVVDIIWIKEGIIKSHPF